MADIIQMYMIQFNAIKFNDTIAETKQKNTSWVLTVWKKKTLLVEKVDAVIRYY